ncbi:MAG: radical SAM family heme chaperone HemW [Acidiferrobacterales bacterium]
MTQLTAPPPLSLYVHLPWCVRKCPYCDFNSHSLRNDIPEAGYIDALLRDLEQDLPRVWGRHVENVYIGGGTPSLFSADAIARLLSELRARIPFNPSAEITLEANPGTVDAERFTDFREAGVNRLSIGVQSFNDDSLKQLGRIHDGKQAAEAIKTAKYAGFEKINLDLMFGLPGQTLDKAIHDIETALSLETDHISLYQLTIEPNTAFGASPPILPAEDAIWDMQQALQSELAQADFARYEISAYATKGNRSSHNLNYWTFGDYLGIGAGAHGKLSKHEGIFRLWKVKHPKDFLQNAGTEKGIGGITQVADKDLPLEFMMNTMRLCEGVPLASYQERTGLTINSILPQLASAEEKGFIDRGAITLRPTEHGQRFLNDMLTLFVPD